MGTIIRIAVSLGILAFMGVVTPSLVQARSLDGVVQSIGQGASNVVNSIDVNKFNSKPQRDLMTLAIGGAVGFAVGGLLTNMGILNIQVLGVALIPIASGLAGFYLANDGYFDRARDWIGTKPTPTIP